MEQLLVQLFAGGIGESFAAMDRTQQEYILRKAYEEFGNIDLPAIKEIMAEEIGPSALEQVKADPKLAETERASLDEMLRIGRSGGMTLEDKANLNSVRGQTARMSKANENRVREQMASRGISGGGAELAMQLSGNQAAAQRASDEGLNIAAQAQKRGMDAILQSGRMAGSMSDRDFEQRGRSASAADARTRYNADNRTRASLYNAGLPQQRFENQLRRAAGRTQQLGNQSNFYGDAAADKRAMAAGIGKAGADAAKASKYDDDEEW